MQYTLFLPGSAFFTCIYVYKVNRRETVKKYNFNLYVDIYVDVYAYVVCVCVCACARVCTLACVGVRVRVWRFTVVSSLYTPYSILMVLPHHPV